MTYQSGDVLHVEGRGDFTFRTAEEIRVLIEERDRRYAAGDTVGGAAVERQLTFTALIPLQ